MVAVVEDELHLVSRIDTSLHTHLTGLCYGRLRSCLSVTCARERGREAEEIW